MLVVIDWELVGVVRGQVWGSSGADGDDRADWGWSRVTGLIGAGPGWLGWGWLEARDGWTYTLVMVENNY